MVKFKDERGDPANWVIILTLITLVAIAIVSFGYL